MPRPIPSDELDAIEKVVRARPGITSVEIERALVAQVARRTLQHRLKRLVDEGRLIRDGEVRWATYRTPEPAPPAGAEAPAPDAVEMAVTLSPEAEDIRTNVRRAVGARTPVGYNRNFLDSYRPN